MKIKNEEKEIIEFCDKLKQAFVKAACIPKEYLENTDKGTDEDKIKFEKWAKKRKL